MGVTGVDILSIIGKTPLIEVDGILAKLETTNPSGSIKDRMADYIIRKAEQRGHLKKGQEIIEATSGNTGISLAMISAIKGYKFTAVMPEHMSPSRRRIMEHFGARVILTPKEKDMAGAVEAYKKLVLKRPEAFFPRQFENTDNIIAHKNGIGGEIIEQAGKIDAFVAGIGTGGTLIGVALALKKRYSEVKIIGVEPEESPVISGEKQGFHGIQGIGEGFVPKLVRDNMEVIDKVIRVRSKHAIMESKRLAREKGTLVGISSGANFLASREVKKRFRRVVTVFPDRGERYL